jgi:AraC-like DNA-binding protein
MNEPQSFGTPFQPNSAALLANRVDIDNGTNQSTKPRSEALAAYRADPSAEVVHNFETTTGRLALLRFAKHSSPKIEFLASSHLIVFSTDGISKGCEWSDGHQTGVLMPLVRHAVMFNPAQHYLRIRANPLKSDCHMLVLAIQPSLAGWRNGLEIDIETVRFQQKIGLNNGAVCRTLLAMADELEAPGLNGASYLDTLIFILMTQLMRCASNLAEPGKTNYAKGGLPGWRLKRAIEILEGDVSKTPSLSEIAQSIRLHPTSFCRAFKQSTGLSPHRYLLVHRIEHAKKMMNEHDLNLTQIALDCGFSSSSQFSAVFKRIVGISPRQFRRTL